MVNHGASPRLRSRSDYLPISPTALSPYTQLTFFFGLPGLRVFRSFRGVFIWGFDGLLTQGFIWRIDGLFTQGFIWRIDGLLTQGFIWGFDGLLTQGFIWGFDGLLTQAFIWGFDGLLTQAACLVRMKVGPEKKVSMYVSIVGPKKRLEMTREGINGTRWI